jgi:hypothetical protein
MKSTAFLLLPLLASAAPQLGGGLFGGLFGSPMKPESVRELPGEMFPQAKRTITRWGPYKMAGYNVRSIHLHSFTCVF